ncbi:MAG: hypothetical protein A7316_07985 [Candidatus Altiarchaeales archaeon WOR_SM1_86-2]|nr:MAG: hypothetical protein A7316_07985 [Candidatus Altiarchaeales archaeon WOR_SM1_86-2]
MVKLSEKIEAEKENVEKALANLKEVMERDEKGVIELSAMATFLHNFYNGIENILKQSLKTRDIYIPKTARWHKELLKISASNKIISGSMSDKLLEYLTFRHFFVHGYGFMLEEEPLEELTDNVFEIWDDFCMEIDTFLNLQIR